MNNRIRFRSAAALIAVSATAAAVLGAVPAGAAPGSVELLAKSIGTAWAGPYAAVTAGVAAGGTATETLEIVNHTSTTGQYVLMGFTGNDGFKALAGTLDVTGLVYDGTYGYVTNAIPAGKSQIITIQFKAPTAVSKSDVWGSSFYLDDRAGNELGQALVEVNVKTTPTVGSAPDDIYASTASSATVGTDPGGYNGLSAVAVKQGVKTTFSVRLQNNAAGTTQINFKASPVNQISGPCAGALGETPWTATAKVGTIDITNEAFGANGYITAPLAKGKSVVVTIAVTVPVTLFDGCAENWLQVNTPDETITLVSNAIAT